ncbi:hypothetical protein [Stenotrophomonas pictorum]|uniref:hypothetical protein n=1 Tax=Stenotrophomonas pictorum TaxID=86184 RepID=UPI000A7FAD23|nr:hypothetical protein [Stenotrophomonas pictorum]
MKRSGRSNSNLQSHHSGVAIVFGVALALGAVTAHSQQAVVEVGPSFGQQILNQINTYRAQIQQAAQYIKDNTQWATDWAQTLREYQEALVTVQGIINSFGLPDAAPLTPVAPNYLVAETCGKDADLKGWLSSVVFGSGGDWKSQQTQICVNIRMMQNRKYNESVDFMLTTAPSFLNSLDRIASLRLLSNRRGDMDAVVNDSLRTANEINAAAKNFEARMKSYDAYIEVMEANQKLIAHRAMKGPSSLAGDLVKTAALKTALSID